MLFFHPDNRSSSPRAARLWAAYEIAHALADFGAAFCFVVGSVMFFFDAWVYPGTWLFLVGSLLFALKPTLRLTRELHYLAIGEVDAVAARAHD